MNKVFKYVPITDLLETIIDNRGKTVPTSEKGIPLIATNCIKHSSIYPTLEKVRYVNEETHTNWFRAHLESNDILFVNKGTPGRVCLVPNPVNFCAAQDMMAFRCNDDLIDYKYLFAVLRSDEIQKKIANNHVGLVIPHLRKQDLSSILIPIRNRKEQELIGNFYVSISEKIELNNRINNELEAMAKTLYDYWFVQFDFPDANGTPYKSSGGKMVWNAELKREIPEGWEDGNIMILANLLGGGTPKTDHPNYWSGDIPFFTPADAEDSIYSTNTKQNITEIGLKNSSTKRYSKGTIFITARGTVGKINIASTDMAMNQSCYALQGKENVNPQFLFFYTNELVHYIKSKASGSIFKALVTNDFKFTKMVVPPIKLIQNYGAFSKSIFEKVLNNKLENQELASLRDWLLPMLMNGQVSVGDVEEELGMVAEEGERYGK